MVSLIYAWINGWVNNREAGDLNRRRAHYNVIVMIIKILNNFDPALSTTETFKVFILYF